MITLTAEQAQLVLDDLQNLYNSFVDCVEGGEADECFKNAKQSIAVIQDAIRAARAQEQEPEYKGWYCAHCERGVDGSEVTFHEQHEVCGRVITDDVPPKPVKQEPVAWMVTSEWIDGSPKTHPLTGRYKDVRDTCDFGDPIPLYAAPVRTKDLTPYEITALIRDGAAGGGWQGFAQRVIAADREKNK